jgi:chromosome partitioning protein
MSAQRRFAVVSQKGGVGKTSLTANLGAAWARRGRRVLVVDMDAQCNLTLAFGFKASALDASILDLMGRESTTLEEVALGTAVENLHLVGGSSKMAGLEQTLVTETMREGFLQRALQRVADGADAPALERYDIVLFDTPPHLGQIFMNAVFAASEALVPVAMKDNFGVQGLMQTVQALWDLEGRGVPIKIAALIRSHVDRRLDSYAEMMEVIRELPEVPLAETEIPLRQAVTNAIPRGVPVAALWPSRDSARAYRQLSYELDGEAATLERAA